MDTTIHVKRIASRKDGTFGVMLIEDLPFCVTLELPWKNNERRVSCIPAGKYRAIRHTAPNPNIGNSFLLLNVPNRSEIMIHGAGLISDLLGCVGVAEFFNDYGNGFIGIANPYKGAAMAEFRKRTAAVMELSINITEHF